MDKFGKLKISLAAILKDKLLVYSVLCFYAVQLNKFVSKNPLFENHIIFLLVTRVIKSARAILSKKMLGAVLMYELVAMMRHISPFPKTPTTKIMV